MSLRLSSSCFQTHDGWEGRCHVCDVALPLADSMGAAAAAMRAHELEITHLAALHHPTTTGDVAGQGDLHA